VTRWEIVITAEAEVIPGDPPPDPENSSEDEDQS
jgi:hypothetical protein